MKKKLLFLTFLTVLLICALAISANAATIYKKADGTELFRYTAADNWVFSSYTGSFPKVDDKGNPITWYITSTKTEGSDKIHTVDFKITLGEAGQIDANGAYSFTSPVTNKNTVSVNFPDNSGIKTFAFKTFGGYNKHSENNLLFVYCPNTLTALTEDTFQETDALIIELDDETPITTIGHKTFHNARNVKVINIPASVQVIDSDDERNGATFAYTYSLKTVTFPSNSKLTRICPYAFWNSNIEEIRFPDSLIAVNANLFRGCTNLKVIRFGANFQYFENVDRKGNVSTGHQSCTHTATGITEIYLPETFYTSKPSVNYRVSYAFDGADNAKFFFTGTAAQLKTSLDNFVNEEWTTGATDNNNIRDAYNAGKVVTWTEYSKNPKNYSGRYIIVEYNKCDAFYKGEHTNVDKICETTDVCGRNCGYEVNGHNPESVTILYGKYTEKGVKTVACGVDGCFGAGEFSVKPIFETLGYSIPQNGCAITTDYKLNVEAFNEYMAYCKATEKTFEFGIFIGNSETFGETFIKADGTADNSYAFSQKVNADGFTKVKCTVADFTADEATLTLVMGLYVIDDGKVSYIQHKGESEYSGTVKKGETTLDVVTIVKIAELQKVTLPFMPPANVPTGNEENN